MVYTIIFVCALAVGIICYWLCKAFSNNWLSYPENIPLHPGVYPVWFKIPDCVEGYTSVAEWVIPKVEKDGAYWYEGAGYWRDPSNGDRVHPDAFYILPARNWHVS
jgi:hypothetical protein